MSIGIFTICCIIYRLEKFVIEVYYPFFHGSLFQSIGHCSIQWLSFQSVCYIHYPITIKLTVIGA